MTLQVVTIAQDRVDAMNKSTRSGGSTWSRATTPQPKPPPSNKLSCQDFWEYHGAEVRYVFAMMEGISPKDDLNANVDHFDADQYPFVKFKREVRPTNLVLQEELLRRAVAAKARIMPRPAQWERSKIINALHELFPPKLSKEDKKFLKQQCSGLFKTMTARANEAFKDLPKEQSSTKQLPTRQPKRQKQKTTPQKKRNAKEEPEETNDEDWESVMTSLRLCHVIHELKDEFAIRRRETGRLERGKNFWEVATAKYNDKGFIPKTNTVKGLGKEYETSTELPYSLSEAATAEDLREEFNDMRERLEALMKPWQKSAKAAVEQEGIVEKYEYKDSLETRIGSSVADETHVYYLWDLANQNEFLGSFVTAVGKEIDADEVENAVERKVVADEEPKAAERTYKDAATAVSDVASEQPKTTSTHHTQTASRAFIMNAESSFLRVQKLYLEQLEMSNTL